MLPVLSLPAELRLLRRHHLRQQLHRADDVSGRQRLALRRPLRHVGGQLGDDVGDGLRAAVQPGLGVIRVDVLRAAEPGKRVDSRVRGRTGLWSVQNGRDRGMDSAFMKRSPLHGLEVELLLHV